MGTRIGILVLIVLGIALILDIIKRKTKIKRIQDKKETEKRLKTSESVFYIVTGGFYALLGKLGLNQIYNEKSNLAILIVVEIVLFIMKMNLLLRKRWYKEHLDKLTNAEAKRIKKYKRKRIRIIYNRFGKVICKKIYIIGN